MKRGRLRLRWRLPLVLALATLIFAGIVALTVALSLRGVFLERLEDDMSQQVRGLATTVDLTVPPVDSLQELVVAVGASAEARFTLIDRRGVVLADSEADPSTLENHRNRPEVIQALAGHEGRARRQSATLGREEVYVAVPMQAGTAPWSQGVLRIAQPASRIDAMLSASWRVPLIVWAVLLIPMLAVAYLLTRSLTRPLERLREMTATVAAGDFTHRTSLRRNDELGELAESLNSMTGQLELRDRELSTELERSREVLAAMTEGVLLIESDGRLLRSNPATGRILGVDLTQMQGRPVVLAARAFPAQRLADKARAAGQPLTEVLELPTGRSLTVEVVPLQPARGATSGATLFVLRDETARRATERMRRDFATNVSHELKTPLAGLSLLAQTLAGIVREDPEQAEKFVGQLSAEIGRLSDLTNDLLTLSRLEETESAVHTPFESVDLRRLVNDVTDEVRSFADTKQHDLRVDVGEGVRLMGNDVALRTLVRNLLDNAIRYTEREGTIKVELQAEPDAKGSGWAVLRVTDNGVGIPQAEQRRIFERFYRVDKARSRETGGTGLGLSIVRHVAERHGGRVDVQSTLGVGSTFTVRLPLG
jgi:two-component system, OmpR family, phosphate regulon sensor histidine kinase PhoR